MSVLFAPKDAGRAAMLATLAGELYAAPDLGTLLERAVEFAAPAVGCDCAGVILWPGHGLEERHSAGSDWRAVQADQLQQWVDDGPGTSPLTADIVTADDTASDAQWPRWGPLVAAELGLHSVLSVALPGHQHRLGVLNLYATRPAVFTIADHALVRPLAVHIALAVTVTTTAGTLERAIASRTRIGQATGVLMERFGLDEADAFAMLKRRSQDQNIALRSVAASLLAERQLPQSRRPPLECRRQ